MTTWKYPSEAPVIEKSVHDYVVSIFRSGPEGKCVEITPISEFAESTRGWDAAFEDGVHIFYFQYKLPNFIATPKVNLKAEMNFRKWWGFDDSQGVFTFNLREKAEKAPKSQHQYLLDLHAAGELAFYLSPLFSDFKQLKKGGSLMPGDKAWLSGNVSLVHSEALWNHVVPHFSGLICFPAHCEVSEPPESHRFIFNTDREVSLHSDPSAVFGVRGVADVYYEVIESWRDGPNLHDGNLDQYIQKIADIIGGNRQGDFFEIIQFEADRLYEKRVPFEDVFGDYRRIQFVCRLIALDRAMRKLIGVKGFVARRARGV